MNPPPPQAFTTQPKVKSTHFSANLYKPTQEPEVPQAAEPKEPAAEPKSDLDIDKLAHCVAIAETNDCTTGMGTTKRNCFGIMIFPNGKRTGKTYATKEESYADFKRIWLKNYKIFPTWNMAGKWTGWDDTATWYSNVKSCYYK